MRKAGGNGGGSAIEILHQICKAAAMGELRERHGWRVLHCLGLAVVAYLAPLVIIALDVGCGSRLCDFLGPEVMDVLEIVYSPVTATIDYFGWLD